MVEEDTVTLVPDAEATSLDQLASFDLDTLVSGAVRLRADRVAITDSTTGDALPLSFAEFDRRVSALAGFWLDLGLKPGERILVAGGAAATSVIALIAALRAGLDVAVAPLHLSGEEMLDFACATDAVALAADAAYGELAPAEELLSVAAQTPRVRLVCSLGGGRVDGAVDADPEKLAAVARRSAYQAERRDTYPHARAKRRGGHPPAADPRRRRARSRDAGTDRHAPADRHDDCTGHFRRPRRRSVAALLAGAPLLLHGPFARPTSLPSSNAPTRPISSSRPRCCRRCCTPASSTAETLASLILVSRRDDLGEPPAHGWPGDLARLDRGPVAGERKPPPIVDLFAIGEYAAVPEVRGRDGDRVPTLAEPHYISLDDRRILAVGRGATFALEGAAVTDGAELQMEERARM